MKKITFSIITPTYNRKNNGYLEACIGSVRRQLKGDFDWEHIIIDDGSTDGTNELIEKLRRNDDRIKYFFQKNQGVAVATQNGINKAQGDYVVFLDDDDLLTEDSLGKRAAYIKDHPDIDWFYAKAKWINGEGKKIKIEYQSRFFNNRLYERMILKNNIHAGTPVIKRKCFSDLVWPSWLRWSQDYFLWLELLRPERKLKVGFLNDYVILYRIHSQMYTKSYLDDKKKLQKKLKLNTEIRKLHGEREAFFSEIYWDLWNKNWQLEYDKKRLEQEVKEIGATLAEKDMIIEEIVNSKAWTFIEKFNKSAQKFKSLLKK